MEIQNLTLGQKLKEIKLITQKPYHFFDRTQDTKGVMLILEGIDGVQMSFNGNNMMGAIESAEKYIEQEKKMGKFRAEFGELAEKEEEKKEPAEEAPKKE